jgi:uncharacterized protein
MTVYAGPPQLVPFPSARPQMPPPLRRSIYVKAHPVEDSTIGLYTPFGHEVTFLPEPQWQAVQEGRFAEVPDHVMRDLVARNFVVPENYDAHALDSYAIPPMPGFVSLWLLIVKSCNMACRYCVVDAEEQTKIVAKEAKAARQAASDAPSLANFMPAKASNNGRMTPEVAEAAIEMFRKSLARHRAPMAKTTIYGGEPMLNRPLLHHVVPILRNLDWPGRQNPLQILCFTNGLVYDEAVTELFKEYGIGVGMSLDGLKAHHDGARPGVNGGETFERVVESYWKYKNAGLSVGISCTIGKHNKDDLDEIVRYFVEELQAPSVQLQTPIQSPANDNPLYVTMREAANASWAAFARLRDAGVEEGLAMRRISRFTSGDFHHRDCFAVGGELAVSPDGTIGPCHNASIGAERYFQGNVLDEKLDPERHPNFIEWHARMPVNMPGCHGCSGIGLCGGGCPYNAYLTRGSIWEKDPHQCGYMDRFIELLIEEVWALYTASRNGAAFGGAS